MKYFTPELLEQVASADDDVADAAHEEWEKAIVRSRRRWQKINKAFPLAVRKFVEQNICMHDAQVLTMERNSHSKTLAIRTKLDAPDAELVKLVFKLEQPPVITADVVPGHGNGRVIHWLYEEWDVDADGKLWFEVLLSNGKSVRLHFSDFKFQVFQDWLTKAVSAANNKVAEVASA